MFYKIFYLFLNSILIKLANIQNITITFFNICKLFRNNIVCVYFGLRSVSKNYPLKKIFCSNLFTINNAQTKMLKQKNGVKQWIWKTALLRI